MDDRIKEVSQRLIKLEQALERLNPPADTSHFFSSYEPQIAVATRPFYRLYNPNLDDYYYTVSINKRDEAIARYGYQDEGVACFIYDNAVNGSIPLYQLFDPKNTHNYYTASQAERNEAVSQRNHMYKAIVGYVFAQAAPATVPLYRLYKAKTATHLYTISIYEQKQAIAKADFVLEAIACYVGEPKTFDAQTNNPP